MDEARKALHIPTYDEQASACTQPSNSMATRTVAGAPLAT